MSLSENEVDGAAMFNLTESDVMAMFPSKIGVARKLIMLINSQKDKKARVCYH